ncbi:MAG TPA: LacI family DNA-binding transcriptional regulator [Rariglobus sp.]
MPPSSRKSSPAARPPGIKQVAAALGVSVGTVSRALNNRYGVDPATRERVLEEARRLGYVPDSAARRLKSHPLLRVMLVFAPFLGPRGEINPAAIATVESLKLSAGRRGFAFAQRNFAGDDDLDQAVRDADFDVVVTYGHFEPASLALLEASGVPWVMLQGTSDAPRHISVRVDTRIAAYQAVLYLAALGHERVALVAGPQTELHHRSYREGFNDAVQEFGLHSPPRWQLHLPPDQVNEDGGAAILAPVLASPDRPTGIVFASDWLAMGGLRAARTAELVVPDQLSLIGYDNLAISQTANPPLTTFDVHLELFSDTVMQAVSELMENPLAPMTDADRNRTICADLVKRVSCTKLRGQSAVRDSGGG